MKSINTLVIEEIQLKRNMDPWCPNRRTIPDPTITLNAFVSFVCPAVGKEFGRLTIKTEARSRFEDDGLRMVIQKFLNCEGEFRHEMRCVDHYCRMHYGIDHVEILIEEPLLSLFEQLFNKDSWIFQKRIENPNQNL